MATWPTGLPRVDKNGIDVAFILRRGYRRTLGGGGYRNQPIKGPAFQRPKDIPAPDQISVTFSFTEAELAIFENFYRDTLRNGTQQFDFPDPVTGTTIVIQFNIDRQIDIDENGFDLYLVSAVYEPITITTVP